MADDLPPPPIPKRERAVDYASVAAGVLVLALVPLDVRAIATRMTRVGDPPDSTDRMRFKLWVNSQPGLPYLW